MNGGYQKAKNRPKMKSVQSLVDESANSKEFRNCRHPTKQLTNIREAKETQRNDQRKTGIVHIRIWKATTKPTILRKRSNGQNGARQAIK